MVKKRKTTKTRVSRGDRQFRRDLAELRAASGDWVDVAAGMAVSRMSLYRWRRGPAPGSAHLRAILLVIHVRSGGPAYRAQDLSTRELWERAGLAPAEYDED